jgi:YXWGXW repeat-containing protein
MQRFDRVIGISAALLSSALLAGCASVVPAPAVHAAALAAPYPPPPKRAEIPPSPPSTDSLWEAGHWTWTGATFAWTPGSYLQRPKPTANWLPGYWVQDTSGWIWNDGHWQS